MGFNSVFIGLMLLFYHYYLNVDYSAILFIVYSSFTIPLLLLGKTTFVMV